MLRCMASFRRAQVDDLALVASWIRSEEECRLWCGNRLRYPVDVAGLPLALEYDRAESWIVLADEQVVAFGQLIAKANTRLHLARLIAAPEHRGKGFGRLITTYLLERALTHDPSVVSLNVFADNEHAVDLYRSLGFAPATRPAEERVSSSIYMERAIQLRNL